jgi:hypothetical protein
VRVVNRPQADAQTEQRMSETRVDHRQESRNRNPVSRRNRV